MSERDNTDALALASLAEHVDKLQTQLTTSEAARVKAEASGNELWQLLEIMEIEPPVNPGSRLLRRLEAAKRLANIVRSEAPGMPPTMASIIWESLRNFEEAGK